MSVPAFACADSVIFTWTAVLATPVTFTVEPAPPVALETAVKFLPITTAATDLPITAGPLLASPLVTAVV